MTRPDSNHGTDGSTAHLKPDHAAMNHDAMSHGAINHTAMNHTGHGDHVGQFRRLFWTMLVIAVPVVAFSHMFGALVGYALPDVTGVTWISPVLGTVMYVWGGRPFLSGAVSELKGRKPGMMLLIALAITVAFLASWGASLGLIDAELDFWWELALLIVSMLLGHWIEMRSRAQTSTALESPRCCPMRPSESRVTRSLWSHRAIWCSATSSWCGRAGAYRPTGRSPRARPTSMNP